MAAVCGLTLAAANLAYNRRFEPGHFAFEVASTACRRAPPGTTESS